MSETYFDMTTAHILYIPTIFLLGFITGSLVGREFNSSQEASRQSGITGRILLRSFMIFAIVFVGTHFFEVPRSSKAVAKALNGLEIFDKKPSYTTDEVYSRIAAFPDHGRALYKEFTYTIDILFPITFFTFLFLLARFTINRTNLTGAFKIVLSAVPIVWLSLDFIENAMIYNLLDKYPAKNHLLAGSLGYITIVKFSMLLLSILLPTTFITFYNIRKRVSSNV